jgi:NADP-dependent 3-hydroxy acid dehydrogenase YdfG
MVDVNLRGLMYTTKAALPHLLRPRATADAAWPTW